MVQINQHPHWYHDNNPNIHLKCFKILQISHSCIKIGSMSLNLTFFMLNMATKGMFTFGVISIVKSLIAFFLYVSSYLSIIS